jgi:type II secretory ATPase GspE/PulE/Tfp pilus assembly ATPase PilB-like protein
MILITGPTGSGKTSTLYATLNDLVETGRNITTLENPVEYELEGVNQGQTNDRAGFTFASGLRAILRQDPDVILVGEIRDRETLEVAVEASLTGHLVLSTLHTNSAVASVTRLLEMGLEPYLLASTVLALLAQRLVRRVCARCAHAVPLAPEVARYFPGPPDTVMRGSGCKECRHTGYRGRTGLFEMLPMTDELRRLILQRATEEALAAVNRRNGFLSLREEGLRAVVDGVTTLDEVLRATQLRE